METQSPIPNPKSAIVLLSGGMDSATTLAIAKSENFESIALSFDYGQRHKVEVDAAKKIAKAFEVKDHVILSLDLRKIGGSALTDTTPVPKGRTREEMGKGIPATYVPARNTIFLSIALALAEARGASTIFIGVNALDYSGYPDCRPEFIRAFETLAAHGTRQGVMGKPIRILTPLMQMTKSSIIQKGMSLGVDYRLTVSCYDPSSNGKPCGSCDACSLRQKGFEEAGMADPALGIPPI